jgi:hypothetical protein
LPGGTSPSDALNEELAGPCDRHHQSRIPYCSGCFIPDGGFEKPKDIGMFAAGSVKVL